MSEEEFINTLGRTIHGGREVVGSRLFRREITEEKVREEKQNVISQSVAFQTLSAVEAGIQEGSGVISSDVGSVLNPLRDEHKESGNPLDVVQDPGFSISPEDVRDPNPGNMFSFADRFIDGTVRNTIFEAIQNHVLPDLTRGDISRAILAAPPDTRMAAIKAVHGIGGLNRAPIQSHIQWFSNQFPGGFFEVSKNLVGSQIEQRQLLPRGGASVGEFARQRFLSGLNPPQRDAFNRFMNVAVPIAGPAIGQIGPNVPVAFPEGPIGPGGVSLPGEFAQTALEELRRSNLASEQRLFDLTNADINDDGQISATELALSLAGDIQASIRALDPVLLNLRKDPNFLRKKIPREQLIGEDPRVSENQVKLIQQANAGFLDDLNLFNTVF